MSNSTQVIQQSTPHLVFADTKAPGSITEWLTSILTARYSYALCENSYPLMLIGSCGSGRSTALTSLLENNIRDKKPFVYINAHADGAQFFKLYSMAEANCRNDDLYLINLLTPGHGHSHSIDPINPLVGDEESFISLFGDRFGSVLHQLCVCEKEASGAVDVAMFESLLRLEYLESLLDRSEYASAKGSLSAYLASLRGISHVASEAIQFSAGFCQEHEVNPRALQHLLNLQQVSTFVDMLEKYPIFSTTPVVDFAKLFQGKKFVMVLLPALELDPDALGILNSLFTCLLSRITGDLAKGSPYPAAVFDGFHPQSRSLRQTVLARFSGANALFAYTGAPLEGSPGYKNCETVTRMAKSVITMRIDDGLPECVQVSAQTHMVERQHMTIRDLCTLQPGHGVGWGAIGVARQGVMRKVEGAGRFKFRWADVPAATDITLTKKGLED